MLYAEHGQNVGSIQQGRHTLYALQAIASDELAQITEETLDFSIDWKGNQIPAPACLA